MDRRVRMAVASILCSGLKAAPCSMALRDVAKSLQDLITREFVDLGAKFAGEAHEAVGGEKAAVSADGDPAGAGGEDGDVVLEEIAGGRLASDGGDLLNVEGRREAGEDMARRAAMTS